MKVAIYSSQFWTCSLVSIYPPMETATEATHLIMKKQSRQYFLNGVCHAALWAKNDGAWPLRGVPGRGEKDVRNRLLRND